MLFLMFSFFLHPLLLLALFLLSLSFEIVQGTELGRMFLLITLPSVLCSQEGGPTPVIVLA